MEKKKILIVEDDVALLNVLVEKFTKEGYKVVTAKDGAVGLKTAFLERPDMILLDIIMPVMDGMTMLQRLRKDEWGKKAAVILLTNLNSAEKVSDALESGAFDYLVKADWFLQDIVDKVGNRLKKK